MKTTPLAAGVKVRALETGYYDHARRREGDVFYIRGDVFENDVKGRSGEVRFKKGDLKDFSHRWMELVSPATPERETGAQAALTAKIDDLKGTKTGDQSVI